MFRRHFAIDVPDECRCTATREGDPCDRDPWNQGQANGAEGARFIPSTTGVTSKIRSRSLTSCLLNRDTLKTTRNIWLVAVGCGNILHLFQCLVFCLTYGEPHKRERNRCSYRIEGVSAGQADRS